MNACWICDKIKNTSFIAEQWNGSFSNHHWNQEMVSLSPSTFTNFSPDEVFSHWRILLSSNALWYYPHICFDRTCHLICWTYWLQVNLQSDFISHRYGNDFLFSRHMEENTEDPIHNSSYSTWNGKIINDTTKMICEMNVLKSPDSWKMEPVLNFLDPKFKSLWDLEWIKLFMIVACIFVVLGAIREMYQLVRYEYTSWLMYLWFFIQKLKINTLFTDKGFSSTLAVQKIGLKCLFLVWHYASLLLLQKIPGMQHILLLGWYFSNGPTSSYWWENSIRWEDIYSCLWMSQEQWCFASSPMFLVCVHFLSGSIFCSNPIQSSEVMWPQLSKLGQWWLENLTMMKHLLGMLLVCIYEMRKINKY